MSVIVKSVGILIIVVGIVLLFVTVNGNTNEIFSSELSPQQAIDNLSVLVCEIVLMCFGIGIFAIGVRMKSSLK